MKPQNPFKITSKSSSEGYQIQLRFKMAFKIASKLLFGASRTPQTAPKSPPKLMSKRISAPVQLGSTELGIKPLFEAILDSFGSDFGPHLESNLSSFEANLSFKTLHFEANLSPTTVPYLFLWLLKPNLLSCLLHRFRCSFWSQT